MELKTIFLIILLCVVFTVYVYVNFVMNRDKDKNEENDEDNDLTVRDINIENNVKDIKKKNIGVSTIINEENTLACQALDNITGNISSVQHEFRSKNGSVYTDCYDKHANIAVDFKSFDYYEFDNKKDTLSEFYERALLSELKTTFFNNFGIIYVKIPQVVTDCYTLNGNNICEKNLNKSVKLNRMQDYIKTAIVAV